MLNGMNPAVARKKEEREGDRQTEGDRISSYIRTELNREIPRWIAGNQSIDCFLLSIIHI